MPRHTTAAKADAKYRRIVRKLDPKLAAADQEFSVAMVLLAAARVGPREVDLMKELDWPSSKIRPIARHLRLGGVFDRGKVHHSGWFDKETGSIAFWCDVAIGMGYLRRAKQTT